MNIEEISATPRTKKGNMRKNKNNYFLYPIVFYDTEWKRWVVEANWYRNTLLTTGGTKYWAIKRYKDIVKKLDRNGVIIVSERSKSCL